MKKKKKFILIPVVIILSITILYFGSELLAIYRIGLTKVCVSKMSLPQRTFISEDYIDYIYVPKAYINNDTFIKKEDIVGKYVKLNAYIPKKSMFYKDFLDDKNNMSDLPHLELKDDEVSYDLFIKDVKTNPGNISKGMNGDLYLTIERKDVVSDLLISGVKIIGLYDVDNKEIKNGDNSSLAIITLAIKKDMVSYINKAIAIGDLSLIIGSDLYEDKEMLLNSSSEIFELLS